MAQRYVVSATGTKIQFLPTPVVRLSALTNDQLLRNFDYLRPDAIYNAEPLALIDRETVVSGGRITQKNVLKAAMVSPELWLSSVAATPAMIPFIKEFPVIDDSVLKNGKFYALVRSLTPGQERKKVTVELDAAGQVTLASAFEFVTLTAPYVPTAHTENTGLLDFGVGHANEIFEIAYVTKLMYPVAKIIKVAEQPMDIGAIAKGTQAYVMHPDLAPLLSITLPDIG